MTTHLYSGTPGSGKSLHMAADINMRLKSKRCVVANFEVNTDRFKPEQLEYFRYMPNDELSPKNLEAFAREWFKEKGHKFGEGKIWLFIDEAQIIFNSRDWNKSDMNGTTRAEWIYFFTQHRKMGYHIVLVSQFDQMLDKQIRSLIEYNWHHRKVNNFGIAGVVVNALLLGRPLVVAVQTWYTAKKRITASWTIGRKSLYGLYDTYKMFG